MTDSTREILRGLSLAGFLLVGLPAVQFAQMSEMNVRAGSQPSEKSAKAQGDAERSSTGRTCVTTAMASMGARPNDRNSQPTPLPSSIN